MDNEESKPSPYLGLMVEPDENERAFIEKVKDVCLEYGYGDFFLAFSAKNIIGGKTKHYKGFSNVLNNELVIYLEAISIGMRQTWNNIIKNHGKI